LLFIQNIRKPLFVFWIILLLAWVLFAPICVMAFDAGPSFGAYFFVGCVWTYPVTLLVAYVLRQRKPAAVFLPFLNIVLLLLFVFLEHLHLVA
jgi:hypothetical protein